MKHSIDSVLVTSPQNDSTIKFVRRLENCGLYVYHLPLIEIHLEPVEKITRKIPPGTSFDWIVITSKNAVDAIAPLLKTKLQGVKIAAVGKATAGYLLQLDMDVAFVPRQYSLKHLMKEWKPQPGDKIFYPHSSLSDNALKSYLTGLGCHVISTVVYHTIPKQIPLNEKNMLLDNYWSIAVFTSPSAVHQFFRQIPSEDWNNKCRINIAIGNTTALSLKKNKVLQVETPQMHTFEGILDFIQKLML